MKPLTVRDKRTIRLGAMAAAVYLALFFGWKGWGFFQTRRADYEARLAEARAVRQEIESYQDKALVVKKLMEDFHLDPARLKRATLVAETSAALQKACAGGIQAGPIRESAGRSSLREAATIQFEATGPVPAIMAMLHNLQSLGYPIVIDTLQLTADPRNPSALKASMTILVLDFDAWKKKEGAPHA
jgi:hypothetical protein